jgi:uncharacterized phiE125 gp8 family phage protein
MNCAWQRTTDATDEPISLTEAKLHLRVSGSDEDTKIRRDIRAARMQIEDYLHRGLVTQTWTYAQDVFTVCIPLPMAGPLASVTSVQYYDASGVLQTLSTDTYDVDTLSEPGCVRLKPDQVWPQTQVGKALAVQVVYVVGQAAAAVRDDIVDALLLRVADRYEHRENTQMGVKGEELPDGIQAILAPQRMWWTAPKATD